MKCLVLAAGYGTRLYPLTKDVPKPLLRVGGEPIMNHLLKKIQGINGVSGVFVVTNDKFFSAFERWKSENTAFPFPLEVINDGTTTPENRLGSIGDIRFVLEKENMDEDILVIGGDNLFDYALDGYIRFAQGKRPSAAVGLFDIGDIEGAKKFGVVKIDKNAKVVSFEEKPKAPQSSLIAMCLYFFPRESLHFVSDYIRETKKADAAGDYIRWLSQRDIVYGYKFTGTWYDIGSIEEYEKAQKEFQFGSSPRRSAAG